MVPFAEFTLSEANGLRVTLGQDAFYHTAASASSGRVTGSLKNASSS
jgi:hypothetical protein